MKKIYLCVVASFLFLTESAPAPAQQPAKIPRIGFLAGNREGGSVSGFQRGLRDLGYVEDKNILIVYRFVEGKIDRIPSLVNELVQLNIDAIVSPLPQAIVAAKRATKTIPIVMMVTQDPVASGLVDSLARPGGNVTGVTRLTRELSGKRLELLKELIPNVSRVGVLWDTSNTPGLISGFEAYEAAARALKIPLQSLQVRNPNNPDFEAACRDAAKQRVKGLFVIRATVLSRYPNPLRNLRQKNACLQCSSPVIT